MSATAVDLTGDTTDEDELEPIMSEEEDERKQRCAKASVESVPAAPSAVLPQTEHCGPPVPATVEGPPVLSTPRSHLLPALTTPRVHSAVNMVQTPASLPAASAALRRCAWIPRQPRPTHSAGQNTKYVSPRMPIRDSVPSLQRPSRSPQLSPAFPLTAVPQPQLHFSASRASQMHVQTLETCERSSFSRETQTSPRDIIAETEPLMVTSIYEPETEPEAPEPRPEPEGCCVGAPMGDAAG